jgi:hypothetical protein
MPTFLKGRLLVAFHEVELGDEESKFARDSPLEEGVTSELVSEAKFPASRENTGNFVRLGLWGRLSARNTGPNTIAYDPIPYASEQGI